MGNFLTTRDLSLGLEGCHLKSWEGGISPKTPL